MRQKGKFENLKLEMKRMKSNILELPEMRWKGAGSITSDGYTIMYSGSNLHYNGVDIVINSKTAKACKGFWTVSGRVIFAKFQCTSFDIGIIHVYAPTEGKDEEEVGEYYVTIDKAMNQFK